MPAATVRRPSRFRRLLPVAMGGLALAAPWTAASAFAQGDVLYGALVMATNAEHPAAPPEGLRGQAENLKTVFGYNEFR